jgi:shikimate dehydrogenase
VSSQRRFILIGHPVAHSVSPAIHQAAYQALGLSHRYDLVDCGDEAAVRHNVLALRAGEVAGANVTVPWKRLALALADRADGSARDTGVANVLSLDASGAVVASNTDAAALADELAALASAPASAVIIGAGGAAQAAVVACKSLGIQQIRVSSRSWLATSAESEWERAERFRALGATPLAWPTASAASELVSELRDTDVIVQATSAGMHGAGPGEEVSSWIPWPELKPSTVAYDVVYNPARTPFLAAAEAAGVRASGGLGMLVRQAARALELWLGRMPPLEPLEQAARRALAQRMAAQSAAHAESGEKAKA